LADLQQIKFNFLEFQNSQVNKLKEEKNMGDPEYAPRELIQ
jgi:hypothetical protein